MPNLFKWLTCGTAARRTGYSRSRRGRLLAAGRLMPARAARGSYLQAGCCWLALAALTPHANESQGNESQGNEPPNATNATNGSNASGRPADTTPGGGWAGCGGVYDATAASVVGGPVASRDASGFTGAGYLGFGPRVLRSFPSRTREPRHLLAAPAPLHPPAGSFGTDLPVPRTPGSLESTCSSTSPSARAARLAATVRPCPPPLPHMFRATPERCNLLGVVGPQVCAGGMRSSLAGAISSSPSTTGRRWCSIRRRHR